MPLSKRNRRGVALLLLIGLIAVFIPRVLSKAFATDAPKISFSEVKLLEKKIEEKQRVWKESKKANKKRVKKYHLPASKFDPNQYAKEDWMKLGLSDKQAEVVVKFAKRGLTSNEDLEKIFVLPEQLIELIKDSTYYPEGNLYVRERDAVTEVDNKQVYVPLNTATEEELLEVPGIGPFYARKIVEYRESLGGFENKEQLMELWKMDLEKFQGIRNFLDLNEVELRKLSINSSSIDELKVHPYISYSVANSIVKMRKQRGSYSSLDDLLESKLIDVILLEKLKHYLTL